MSSQLFALVTKIVLAGCLFFMLTVGSSAGVVASEGTANLNNLRGGDARCFAASILMRDFNYKLLLSCRDLLYPGPAGSDLFSYVLWAQEVDSDKLINLGSVGVGRGEYTTTKPFSKLFITQERDSGVRKPADTIIMQGQMQSIAILESPSTVATVAPSQEPLQPENSFLATPSPSQSPGPTATTSGFSILRLVGGILLGIIVFVVIVGLISTSRRRPIE